MHVSIKSTEKRKGDVSKGEKGGNEFYPRRKKMDALKRPDSLICIYQWQTAVEKSAMIGGINNLKKWRPATRSQPQAAATRLIGRGVLWF